MFTLWKSKEKFSIASSNFANKVFCNTFYFINQVFFFIRDVFWERIFSKEHLIGLRGSVIIEKQYFIVRVSRRSNSQVLKNLLNVGELYEIHFLGIWKNISSICERLILNIPEPKSSLSWSFIFSISHFSSLETECTEAAVYSCSSI